MTATTAAPAVSRAQAKLREFLLAPRLGDFERVEKIAAPGQPLWWEACRDAVLGSPEWLWQADHDKALALIRDSGPTKGGPKAVAEAVSAVSRALASNVPVAASTKAEELWRKSPGIFLPQNAGEGTDAAAARARAGASAAVSDRLRTVLDGLGDWTADPGRAMLAITALLLSAVKPDALRPASIRVVFGKPAQEDAPPGTPPTGTSGRLELRVLPGGPACLFPDPRTLRVQQVDEKFGAALEAAWKASARPPGCVLWRIVLDEEMPDAPVDGGSLGAAFALALRDLERRTRATSRGNAVAAWSAAFRSFLTSLFIGPRPGYAVTGILTDVPPSGYTRRAGPWLAQVGDFEVKVDAAKRKGLQLIAPLANRVGAGRENVYWVENLRGASRRIRRLRKARAAIALTLVAVTALGTAAGLKFGQHGTGALRSQALSARLTSTADSLRGTDPGLAAQFDAAAYQADPTPVADTDLLNDESSPLDTYLPAGAAPASEPASALAVSPAGNAVAVVSDSTAVLSGPTVRLYDAANPARPPAGLGGQVPDTVPAWPLGFSPDGRVLAAVGAGGAVDLWNVADPAAPTRLGTLSASGITALAFARAARVLAVGTIDGDIQLWSVADPAHPVPLGAPAGPAAGHSVALNAGSITSLMFVGPGAATLWTATRAGAIEIWNVSDPTGPAEIATPVPADNGTTVQTSFSPTGEVIQTDSYGNSFADDLESFAADPTDAYRLGGPSELPTAGATPAVISPGGQVIATRDADGNITLVNRVSNYPLGRPFPQNAIYSAGTPTNPMESSPGLMAFNAAGTVLAADDHGSGIYLWHLPAGYTVDPNLTDIVAPTAGFAVNGGMLASILGGDVSAQKLTILPMTTFSEPTPPAPGLPGIGDDPVAVADDRKLVAKSTGPEINLVRPDSPDGTGQRLGSLAVTARSLALSARGTVLAVVDADGGTTVWNVASPSQPRQLGQPFGTDAIGAALSADGTVVALLSGQAPTSESLQLWSLADPTRPERLGAPVPETSGQTVSAMAISPDNQTLAVARPSGEVDLVPLGPQPGGRYGVPLSSNYDDQTSGIVDPSHTGVVGLAYRPDGTTLTAVNGDSSVRVWNLKPATSIAAVCAATGPSMSAATWQKYVTGAAFTPPCPADVTATGPRPAQPPATGSPAQGAPAAICAAGDLTLAMGPVELKIAYTRQLVLTNVSHAACSVPGTPAVNLVGPRDARGSSFNLLPEAQGQLNQPDPKHPVTLQPGGMAHMDATFLSGRPGSTPPPGYIYTWVPQQLQVVLPGSHATLSVPWASSLTVLQQMEPHNPGNYYTPLLPGPAPSSTGPTVSPTPAVSSAPAVSPSPAVASPGQSVPPVPQASVYSGASYHFGYPDAIAVDGRHLWIASSTSDSVTELNASDGSLVRALSAASYQFKAPYAIAASGSRIWVPNYEGNSVTEINASDGSLVGVLSAASYRFSTPQGIAADGTRVWVANQNGNSVTELNASDGSLVRVVSGGSYGFDFPSAIAADGTHIWVANSGGSVTELNASDGSWVRTVSGASYGFSSPLGIAADGTHVWVTNRERNSVTEINASDGSAVRDLFTVSYQFNSPQAITADGSHVWVVNVRGNSVTELNAGDGSLARVLSAGVYHFDSPAAVAVAGTEVWVASGAGNSVTELPVG